MSTYEVFLARDPFEPVVPVVDSGTGGRDAARPPPTSPTELPDDVAHDHRPTTSPTTSSDHVADVEPNAVALAIPARTDGCQQELAVVCDGHRVSLVDVFQQDGQSRAAVRVDDALYEVSTGETFATSFLVRSVEPPCVTLLYGDDAFTLCEGESVLK